MHPDIRPNDEPTFNEMDSRLCAGDQNASWIADYYADLIRIACSKLYKRTKTQTTPHSVVMSALISVAIDPKKIAALLVLSPGQSLVRLLGRHVLRHCDKWNKRIQRHPPVYLEGQIIVTQQSGPDEEGGEIATILDRLSPILTKEEVSILMLSLQGYSSPEIANQLNLSVSSVEFTIDELRIRIKELDT